MFSTIVVGTDGSESANVAVSAAAEIARQGGSTLHLVAAYQTRQAGVSVPLAGAAATDSGVSGAFAAERGREMLEATAANLSGIVVEQHVVPGEAADVLVQMAEQTSADLIVVGSKGMNRRILGSVPNSVAHNAPCAVLIVKTV